MNSFSPRARGCSDFGGWVPPPSRVFPACAGMFRRLARGSLTTSSFPACAGMFLWWVDLAILADGFPRVRGDVPVLDQRQQIKTMFSPRARGCSQHDLCAFLPSPVFPACAGMFLPILTWFAPLAGFPRVRGDVPADTDLVCAVGGFSPRARGCSWKNLPVLPQRGVFPACAGMFPRTGRQALCPPRFPRVRGDVPWRLR